MNEEKLRFVELGYKVSTDFTVRASSVEEAQAMVNLVGTYNWFTTENVSRALESCHDAMDISFGRAGSPVLYVTVPYWDHQKFSYTKKGYGTKLSRGEREEIAENIINAFVQEAGPDEHGKWDYVNGYNTDEPYKLRFWWD